MEDGTPKPIGLIRLLVRGLAAVGVAVAFNTALLSLVVGNGLVEPFGALTYPPVTMATLLGVVAATALYGAFTRITRDHDAVFFKVAVVALVLSFAPTIAVGVADPTANWGAVAVLMIFHVSTAGICLWILTDWYSPIGR